MKEVNFQVVFGVEIFDYDCVINPNQQYSYLRSQLGSELKLSDNLFRSILEKKDSIIAFGILLDSGKIIATAQANLLSNNIQKNVYIYNVVTDNNYRRYGFGRKILKKLENRSLELWDSNSDINNFSLVTKPESEGLISFYTLLGFSYEINQKLDAQTVWAKNCR